MTFYKKSARVGKPLLSLPVIYFAGFLSVFNSRADILWNEDQRGNVTRCFATPDIEIRCEDFGLQDPTHPTRNAEIEILATDSSGHQFSYSYFRAFDSKVCKTDLKKIGMIMKNSRQACITGNGELLDRKTGVTLYRLQAFETKRGIMRR